MSITLPVRKLLWGLSAARCNKPDCRTEVFDESTPNVRPSVVGDEAHIVARELDGPRGKSTMSSAARDGFDNLILLCKKHHKVIDDNAEAYPVKVLKEWKHSHEAWISSSLSQDKRIELDALFFESQLETLLRLIEFPTWQNYMSGIYRAGDASIAPGALDRLNDIATLIQVTRWPDEDSLIVKVLRALGESLNSFLSTFDNRSEPFRGKIIFPRFYKNFAGDIPRRHAEEQRYYFERSMLEDLLFEVTRYVNWVADLAQMELVDGRDNLRQRASLNVETHGATSYALLVPEFTEAEKNSSELPVSSPITFPRDRYNRTHYSTFWKKESPESPDVSR